MVHLLLFAWGRHPCFSRSSGVKAKGHTLIIVVDFRKYTVWTVQLGLPNLIHTLILNQLLAFLSNLLASLRRNYFQKRSSGAPLHTLSKLCDVPVRFVPLPSFDGVYYYICGRRRVAVARYLMICLVSDITRWTIHTVLWDHNAVDHIIIQNTDITMLTIHTVLWYHNVDHIYSTLISQYHRSLTLLWYNQCNGGYGQFVTAGTISFNGGFTFEKKRGRMDGMKRWIFLFVCIIFSNKI